MSERSLINQYSQIRGSQNYGDTLDLSLAEQTGRSYQSGTITVTSGSATITDSSNVFSESEKNNFIVISTGDAAGVYTISSTNDTVDCTITPTPTATFSGSYTRHYYQNLEDDLNYIRSQLKQITGEGDWQTTPVTNLATLSGINIGLEPYEDTRIVFQNSSGLTDSANLTYDYNNEIFTTKSVVAEEPAATLISGVGTITISTYAGSYKTISFASGTDWNLVRQGDFLEIESVSAGYYSVATIFVTWAGDDNYTNTAWGYADADVADTSYNFRIRKPLISTKLNETITSAGNDDSIQSISTAHLNYTNLPQYVYSYSPQPPGSVSYGSDYTGIFSVLQPDGTIDVLQHYINEKKTYVGVRGEVVGLAQATGSGVYSIAVEGYAYWGGNPFGGYFVGDTSATTDQGSDRKSYGLYAKGTTYAAGDDGTPWNDGNTSTTYGVYAEGKYGLTSYGIYASAVAYTAGTAWAGYFAEGNVMIENSLQFGADATSVSGITTSISSPGVDDRLATEQSIVEYVTSATSSLDLTPYQDTRVVFQNSSGLVDSADFTFDDTNKVLTVSGSFAGHHASLSENNLTEWAGSGVYNSTLGGVIVDESTYNDTIVGSTLYNSSTGQYDTVYNKSNIQGVGYVLALYSSPGFSDGAVSFTVREPIFNVVSSGTLTTKSYLPGFTINENITDNFATLNEDQFVLNTSVLLQATNNSHVNEASNSVTPLWVRSQKLMNQSELSDGSWDGWYSYGTYIQATPGAGTTTGPYTTNSGNTVGTYSAAYNDPGTNIGGWFYSYNNRSDGAKSDAVYALKAYAYSNVGYADVAYGIYAEAEDADTNWAGYFAKGDVMIKDNLQFGADSTSVSGITTLITASGVDDRLATEQAIVEYVASELSPYNTDKIYEGDSYVEVVDSGASGEISIVSNGFETANFSDSGAYIYAYDITLGDGEAATTTIGIGQISDTTGNISATLAQAGLPDSGGSYIVEDSSAGMKFTASSVNDGNYIAFESSSGVEVFRVDADGLTLASGVDVTEFSSDGTFAGNSDDAVPTEQAVKTYVDGSVSGLASETYVDNSISTASGSLQSDIIWEIVDTPSTQIRPKAAHLGKAIYTEGNVTIGGDLTVTGTLFYTDTETVQVSDNLLVINYGEVGAGVTAGEAGIEVDRGSETAYQFLFDEGTDTFRIGVSGTQNDFNTTTLQPVATREDSPVNTRVAWWDASSYTFRTQGDTYITVNSGTNSIDFYTDYSIASFSDTAVSITSTDITLGDEGASVEIGIASITDTTGNISTTLSQASLPDTGGSYIVEDSSAGAKFTVSSVNDANYLAFESSTGVEQLRLDSDGLSLNSGASVNEIVASTGSLSGSSTDDQLATAKLIYNELQAVTTGSGSIDHNLLNNLQGGTADEYYHLTATNHSVVSAITSTDVSNWDTAYSWGDHSGLYDTSGAASSAVSSHESTYNHSNYDTAYGWGDHAGLYDTVGTSATLSGVLQPQITQNTNYIATVSGTAHTHYDVDMTYDSGNTWYYDGSFTTTPSGLVIFVNGVKNRNHSDYYTTTVSGGALYVEFNYEVDVNNWVNMEYVVYE